MFISKIYKINYIKIIWFNIGRELLGKKLFFRWGFLLLFKELVVGVRIIKDKKY